MRDQYLINSIYMATEGEGIHLGQVQIFVRFQGCNIGCLNCDSVDTWEFDQKYARSLESVLDEIEQIADQTHGKIKRISITGGDPTHPKHTGPILNLVKQLKGKGYWVNIEASGTRIVNDLFDIVDFISFDYKTPSTGVKTDISNLSYLQKQFQGKFQIKSVIEDKADFYNVIEALQELEKMGEIKNFDWCLTPCYKTGEEFPRDRFLQVQQMNQVNGAQFRVIGQQHKWIYGSNQKNV